MWITRTCRDANGESLPLDKRTDESMAKHNDAELSGVRLLEHARSRRCEPESLRWLRTNNAQREAAMSCVSCGAKKQAKFSAEMIIHFKGLKNVDKPGVWLFQKLLVCLDCGTAQFSVPETELRLISKTDGAAAD
jgi:hypothetical protein